MTIVTSACRSLGLLLGVAHISSRWEGLESLSGTGKATVTVTNVLDGGRFMKQLTAH